MNKELVNKLLENVNTYSKLSNEDLNKLKLTINATLVELEEDSIRLQYLSNSDSPNSKYYNYSIKYVNEHLRVYNELYSAIDRLLEINSSFYEDEDIYFEKVYNYLYNWISEE